MVYDSLLYHSIVWFLCLYFDTSRLYCNQLFLFLKDKTLRLSACLFFFFSSGHHSVWETSQSTQRTNTLLCEGLECFVKLEQTQAFCLKFMYRGMIWIQDTWKIPEGIPIQK